MQIAEKALGEVAEIGQGLAQREGDEMAHRLAMAIGAILCASVAADRTLERIGASGAVKIAHRTEARPFSYLDETGAPTGLYLSIARRFRAQSVAVAR